ncbi:alpha-1A adrenergic receptor-like [Babylonia areolata]|uniref:alpha-1A adrenergic receptor-like n=1 Tax=Babylonia areolata TaxID=304850 RepID=UPI003FD370FC
MNVTHNDTTNDVMTAFNITTTSITTATATTNDVRGEISSLNATGNGSSPTTTTAALTLTHAATIPDTDSVITTAAVNLTDLLLSSLNDTFTTTAVSDPANVTINATTASSPLMTSSPSTATASAISDDVVTLEQRVTSAIDLYVPPFLFFIGTVANVFVVMVMQSKQFRQMSTSFYMAVSSVVDIISLVVSLPAHYLYVNFPQVFDNVRDAHAMCSFFNLFGWGSSDMGVLLTVAMTTERSLAIQFPLKAPTLCTVKRAKIVTVCLFLFEIIKVGHLIFTSRVAPKEVTAYLCDVDRKWNEDYRIFYDYYWPYVHNISLVLAFIVIIIGNVIITVHVKRSDDSKDMGEGAKSAGGSKPGKTSSRSRQLSLMLIIDSVTIILCTLPFSIYVVVAQSFQLFDDSPQGRAKQSLIFSITFYLLYVNRCANFFLYCISGARFRQALKEILSRKPPPKNNYITGGATNTRNATSSTFTADGEGGNKVCMNPMGPQASAAGARNGGSKRISTSFTGPATVSGVSANGPSKLERHYGYGKTANGK